MANSGSEVVSGWIATTSRNAIGTSDVQPEYPPGRNKSAQNPYGTLHKDLTLVVCRWEDDVWVGQEKCRLKRLHKQDMQVRVRLAYCVARPAALFPGHLEPSVL